MPWELLGKLLCPSQARGRSPSSRGVRVLSSRVAALTGPGLLWGGESTRWGSCVRVGGMKSPLRISATWVRSLWLPESQ